MLEIARQLHYRPNLLVRAMQTAHDPKALLEEFDSLETPWTRPESTGFEPRTDPAAA